MENEWYTMRTANRAPAISNQKSVIRNQKSLFARFLSDESGQGIVFAAATLLLLVGFVAFVFNIGRLLDRRTKVQIAADAAAYSGAMVEADAVSAIAYINSAMSQVYYNAMKQAVDVDVTAVAAELERLTNPNGPGTVDPNLPGYQAYSMAWNNASKPNTGLQMAKQLMVNLSQLENAIAIVTPRLVQEEMFAVAGRAGGERMSVFPSFRMFPMTVGQPISYMISCLGNGWQITNLTNGSTGTLTVTLSGNTWDIQSISGVSSTDVQFTQTSGTSWQIAYFQPPGNMLQQVTITQDPILGWVVADSSTGTITFTPVTVDGVQATQVSQGGYTQTLAVGADGNVSVWNGSSFVSQNSTTLGGGAGGVNVQVNVTNQINFAGGGSAYIGNPTTLRLPGAQITLGNPPNILTGSGPVSLSIFGFSPTDFSLSAEGLPLNSNSNGRWISHYSPSEESWSRNRLVVMGTDANGNAKQWEFQREQLGALLTWDQNGTITQHAFMGRGYGPYSGDGTWPAWASTANGARPWFNTFPSAAPLAPSPVNTSWQPNSPNNQDFNPRPDSKGIFHLLPTNLGSNNPNYPPPGAYYQTSPLNSPQGCPACHGTGRLNGNPLNPAGSCPFCFGRDNSPTGDSTYSNIRVSIGSLWNSPLWPYGFRHDPNGFPGPVNAADPDQTHNDYLDVRLYSQTSYNVSAPPWPEMMPLLATEDFFKWGVNVGVWKHPYNGLWNTSNGNEPDNLMLSNVQDPLSNVIFFPSSVEPAWGTVAIASARVGLPIQPGAEGDPAWGDPSPYIQSLNGSSYRYGFTSAELNAGVRESWLATSSPLDELYYANVQANLYASTLQVDNFDLDESILASAPAKAIDESGLSYLWSAILAQNTYSVNQRNGWMDRFNGQADPRVGAALRNMRNRQGATFDYGSGELNQVVEH